MRIPVKHPDTIPGLAPDCRRILREEYQRIQVAASPGDETVELERPDGLRMAIARPRVRDVGAAIAEYRRVAKMWGVDVG